MFEKFPYLTVKLSVPFTWCQSYITGELEVFAAHVEVGIGQIREPRLDKRNLL
jgi:hypothetical protein